MSAVSADAASMGLSRGTRGEVAAGQNVVLEPLEHEPAPERAGVRSAPARSADTLTAAGDLLRALAAPVRIAIVLELRESERCVHELVAALGVTQPLISQHLRVLKSAGVVSGERHGREVVYRLADEHLSHIVVDAVAHAEEIAASIRRSRA
jgi:ArsR family transcriptional regulator, zinc-responsive transcriptional repressor